MHTRDFEQGLEALRTGRPADAIAPLRIALHQLREENGAPSEVIEATFNLAMAEFLGGSASQARDLFLSALAQARLVEHPGRKEMLSGALEFFLRTGDGTTAASLVRELLGDRAVAEIAYIEKVGCDQYLKHLRLARPMSRAAEQNDVATVKQILAEGLLVDAPVMRQRLTALHVAASNGNGALVRLLLDAGAAVDARGLAEKTPLHLAIQEGHLEVVEMLLDYGADARLRDEAGMTALHWAVSGGELRTVGLLVQRGVDPNIRNANGGTALYTACQLNKPAVVLELLNAGADPDATEETGLSGLHVAAFKGHCEVIDVLVQARVNLNAIDDKGTTSLMAAAQSARVEAVRRLLAVGADANVRNKSGGTALHDAACQGNADIARLLLQHGADPAVEDVLGHAPSYWATKNGHPGLAGLLQSAENARKRGNAGRRWRWLPW